MAITFSRPEWALEIVPEGAIAARRQPDSGRLAAAAFVPFEAGAVQATFAAYVDKDAPRVPLPGLPAENSDAARASIVSAVQRALSEAGARNGAITLILPDTAVRVIMLDFDTLPEKAEEALGVVRFRLRKLVPFEVDDAQVSYQVLTGTPGKGGAIRALAVAIPGGVLRAYEEVVRAAGYEPGVIVPSTLAALGMIDGDSPAMLVQATPQYVTTAITRGQDLLLHRTHELPQSQAEETRTPTPAQVEEALDFLGQTNTPEAFAAEAGAAVPEANEFAEGSYPSVPEHSFEEELVQALTVAAAFYEDFTGSPPQPVRVCGSLGLHAWEALISADADAYGLTLAEAVTTEDLGEAGSSGMSRAQLGAVCGALRS